MSTKNELFFAELLSEKAAKWSAGVAFDRSNGLPLDQWSVFQTKAAATEYLSNSKAYPGQVIAYAEDNGEMTACVLSQNAEGTALTLKPIGIIPMGDNKTVDVSATGVITLKGAANATAGQQPRIVNKGTAEAPQLELEWYTPDNSTVDGLASAVGGLVETVNGVDGDETKPGLVAEVNALKLADVELAADIKEIADDYVKSGDIANFETKANVKEVADAFDAYKTSNNTALAGVKATAEAAATKTYTDAELAKKADKSAYDQTVLDLTALTNKVNAFLEGTGTEAALDSLQELINYIETHDDTDISGILASIQGIENKLAGVDTTVAAYVEAAIDALEIGDYAKAADLTALAGRVAALEEVDNFTQAEFAEFNTANSAAIEKAKTDAIADADAKLANKLDKTTFETFKGENTTAIGTAKAEAIAAAATDATEKADKALADAKADTADKLKSYSTTLEMTAAIKAAVDAEATIARAAEQKNAQDIVNLGTRVDSVSTQANKGVNDAQAAAQAAAAAQTTADGAVIKADANATEIGKHANRLSTLEAFKTAHETAFSGLNDRVGAAETAITGLTNNKAEKSVVNAIDARVAQVELDLNGKPAEEGSEKVVGLKERVEANATEIVVVDGKVTALAGRVATLETKPDNDTTYTFANGTNGTFTVTPKDGSAQTVDTGAKTYTDAEIKKVTDVMTTDEEVEVIRAALAKAISDEASRADTAEKANAKAISDEAARAKAAEEELAGDITDLDNAIKAVLDNEGGALDSIKELATWVEEHGEDAAEMAGAIADNTAAIKAIYTPAVEEVKDENGEVITEAVAASGVLVDEITRIEKEVNDLKAVDHAAAHEATLNSAKAYTDTALETAKKYADDEIGKLPVVDNDTIKVNEQNKMYVNRVSVALLDDTGVELILCGGNA